MNTGSKNGRPLLGIRLYIIGFSSILPVPSNNKNIALKSNGQANGVLPSTPKKFVFKYFCGNAKERT